MPEPQLLLRQSTPVCALEGLPGAGKTTLANALRARVPRLHLVPEHVRPVPAEATIDYFVRNDLEKEAVLDQLKTGAVVDRCWVSTVCYHHAMTNGAKPLALEATVSELYDQRTVRWPGIIVLLTPPRALKSAIGDGLWLAPEFRRRMTDLYRGTLAASPSRVLEIRDSPSVEETVDRVAQFIEIQALT